MKRTVDFMPFLHLLFHIPSCTFPAKLVVLAAARLPQYSYSFGANGTVFLQYLGKGEGSSSAYEGGLRAEGSEGCLQGKGYMGVHRFTAE